TTAVFDKVKDQAEQIKTITNNSAKLQTAENTSSKSQSEVAARSRPNASTSVHPKQQASHNEQANHKQKNNLHHGKPLILQESRDMSEEIIDLTTRPTKFINHSTLLVGSSMLKGIKTNELNPNTTVRSFPGATVETLRDRLKDYNIDKCKTVILHVGGNDASNNVDVDSFSEAFIELLHNLASKDRRLIVSGLIPRKDVDLEPYNEKLRTICEDNDIDFIDHYNGFLLATGEMPETHFYKDKIHLNSFGTRKFLSNVDKVCKIAKSLSFAGQRTSGSTIFHNSRRSSVPAAMRYRSPRKYCHICAVNGHSTDECWYNGRSSGLSRRSSV
ncbi:MAG: SGNH/GDSL hydrolase family protein, partial [Candidatus Thiodiazotropha endolucinida]|nr:SGNH/GDSL hydrolase family protein [Candidatus Thiodiazotropha taylori]MCW4345775.1 SGNH/GDSL hydrolase family protein [Candidatus Thiodiazotropha endolucinida]